MSYLPQLEHDLSEVADRLVAEEGAAHTAATDVASGSAPMPARVSTPASASASTRVASPVAALRRRRRAPRLPLLGAGALAAAGIVAALALGVGTGGKLDVAQEAEAALATDGTILHVVTTGTSINYVNGVRRPRAVAANERERPDTRVEAWATTGPPRWRTVVSPATAPSAAYAEELRRSGRPGLNLETSYADGAQSHYEPGRSLTIVTGFSDRGRAAQPLGFGPGNTTSLEDLRGLLRDGKLRDRGRTRIGRRPALRLAEVTPAATNGAQVRVTYFVDPDSYTPIRVSYRWRPTGWKPTRTMRSFEFEIVTDFATFERLPLTPENERLLQITPAAGTPTTSQTRQEAVRKMRATSPKPVHAKP